MMAKRKPGTHETVTVMIDGKPVTHVGLRVWCRDIIGMAKSDERHVCTRARTDAVTNERGAQISVNVHGARTTFGGRWIMPMNATADVIPARTGGAITRRADGRIRFNIYLTDTEHVELAKRFDVVDLRIKRAERRAAKSAAKTDTATAA